MKKFWHNLHDGVALVTGVVFYGCLAYCAVYSVLRILFFVWGLSEKSS